VQHTPLDLHTPLRVYLACSRSGHEYRAAHAARHPHILVSYADQSAVRGIMRHHLGTPEMIGQGHLIIDSGAFTAYTQGLRVDVHEYAEFVTHFEAVHGEKLASLEVMNLDVIGDQQASDRNEQVLREEYGLAPVPVFTFGAPLAGLEQLASRAHRLALGGLVRHAQDRVTLDGWLERCFDALQGAPVSVHLLGITQERVLRRFPACTCDSSTWSNVVRAGRARHLEALHPGNTWKVPALVERIGQVQQLERAVTDHWETTKYTPAPEPLLLDGVA